MFGKLFGRQKVYKTVHELCTESGLEDIRNSYLSIVDLPVTCANGERTPEFYGYVLKYHLFGHTIGTSIYQSQWCGWLDVDAIQAPCLGFHADSDLTKNTVAAREIATVFLRNYESTTHETLLNGLMENALVNEKAKNAASSLKELSAVMKGLIPVSDVSELLPGRLGAMSSHHVYLTTMFMRYVFLRGTKGMPENTRLSWGHLMSFGARGGRFPANNIWWLDERKQDEYFGLCFQTKDPAFHQDVLRVMDFVGKELAIVI